jgi:hypothetical protein
MKSSGLKSAVEFNDDRLKEIVRSTSHFSHSTAPEESAIVYKEGALTNEERNLLLKYVDDHPRFSAVFSMRLMKAEIFQAIGYNSNNTTTNTISRDELYAIHKFVKSLKGAKNAKG